MSDGVNLARNPPSNDHLRAMAKEYSDDVYRRALDLFMAGETVTAICRRKDMPTRPTLYKRMKAGYLTDGIPWDEYRERKTEELVLKAKEETMRRRAESGRAFLDEIKESLETSVYNQVMAKIEAGDFEVTIGDLDKIAKLYALLDNQASDKLEFAAWFARQMFDIAIDIMDERQFALFKTRAMKLQHEVELKLNPMEHAALPA